MPILHKLCASTSNGFKQKNLSNTDKQTTRADTTPLEEISVNNTKSYDLVNNYYKSDKESGWKQLQQGEIPPNRSGQKKHHKEDNIKQNSNIIWKTGPSETNMIEEVGRYHVEEPEIQNMAPPTTHNFNYPPPLKPTAVSDTSSMLD